MTVRTFVDVEAVVREWARDNVTSVDRRVFFIASGDAPLPQIVVTREGGPDDAVKIVFTILGDNKKGTAAVAVELATAIDALDRYENDGVLLCSGLVDSIGWAPNETAAKLPAPRYEVKATFVAAAASVDSGDSGRFATPSVTSALAHFVESANVVMAVYADALPPCAIFPAAVVASVSIIPTRSHSGKSGMARSRAQVDCWTRDPDDVEAIYRGLVEYLEQQRGEGIRSISEINARDLNEPERNRWRKSIDFEVWHDDPIPAN